MTQKEAIRWFEEDTAQLSKAIHAINELAKQGQFGMPPKMIVIQPEDRHRG